MSRARCASAGGCSPICWLGIIASRRVQSLLHSWHQNTEAFLSLDEVLLSMFPCLGRPATPDDDVATARDFAEFNVLLLCAPPGASISVRCCVCRRLCRAGFLHLCICWVVFFFGSVVVSLCCCICVCLYVRVRVW